MNDLGKQDPLLTNERKILPFLAGYRMRLEDFQPALGWLEYLVCSDLSGSHVFSSNWFLGMKNMRLE